MERISRRGLIFLLSLFLVLSVLVASVVLPFLTFVFFGLFAAFLSWPLHVRLRRRMPHRVSAGLLTITTYAVILVPIALLVASILADVAALARRIQDDGIDALLHDTLNDVLPPELAASAAKFLGELLTQAASALAPEIVSGLLNVLLGAFIFGFVVYYSLWHGDGVVWFVRGLVPLREERVSGLFQNVRSSLHAVFYGVLIVALLQGAAGGVVWWLTGLPNPFFYGAVMFVLSILPFAGPSFVLLPAGVFTIAQGDVGKGVFLIFSAVILVGGIDNVARPFLVGRFGRISPALVLIGLAGGLVAFGIAGFVLGPVLFALWVAVASELRAEVQEWKHEAFFSRVTAGAVPVPMPDPPDDGPPPKRDT